ncbi:hypothetical protein BKA69DRAFT_1053645 [Paraphysoderma sedebokerense]|nr:hypothetical protein BKA69DRAFT_1053645 [Paraphysoderma sedebokerense]
MEMEIDEISRLRSEVEQLKKTNQFLLEQQYHIEHLTNMKKSEPDKFVEEATLNIENTKRQNKIYKERLMVLVNQSTDFHYEVSEVPATEHITTPTKQPEVIDKEIDGAPHLELEGERLSLKDLNEAVEIVAPIKGYMFMDIQALC